MPQGTTAQDREQQRALLTRTLTYTLRQGVTVQTIRQQYMSRNFQEEEIILKFGSKLLANPMTMRELNDHGDNLIAIEAVKPSDLAARMPRQPLQPSNVQAPAKPASPILAPVKPSLEAGKRYTSPYSPRVNPLVTSNTPGSVVSGPSFGQRRSPFGYDENANGHGIAPSPVEPLMKSEEDGEGVHSGMGIFPAAIQAWDQGTSTEVAQLQANPLRDTLTNNQSHSAPVKSGDPPFTSYANDHENLKVKYPGMSHSTALSSSRTAPVLTVFVQIKSISCYGIAGYLYQRMVEQPTKP